MTIAMDVEQTGLYPIGGLREGLLVAARWIVAGTTVVAVFLSVAALAVIDIASGGLVGSSLMAAVAGASGAVTRPVMVGIYLMSFSLSIATTGLQKAIWDMVLRQHIPLRSPLLMLTLVMVVIIAALDTVADASFGAQWFTGVPAAVFPVGLDSMGLVPKVMTALWAVLCLLGEFGMALILFHLGGGVDERSIHVQRRSL